MSKPLKKWSQKLLLILLTASLIFASSIVNANASVSSDFNEGLKEVSHPL
ncbi:hypothetical protein [Thermoanaerobacterium thermosaccharolyticum]